MQSIYFLILAAQWPFAAAAGWQLPFLLPEVVSPGAAWSEAGGNANDEHLRHLLASTKSVMKRRQDDAGADPRPDDAQRAMDQVVQAGFNQPTKGTGPANTGAAAGADSATGARGATAQPPGANNAAPAVPPIDDAVRAAAEASAALLAGALSASNEGDTAGRPISLAEALGRVSNPRQRLEVASLYWKVALALADLNWAVDESSQLDALPGNSGAIDSPLLAAARAAAAAKMLEAKAAAAMAQQELADAMGQPMQPPPVTVEEPLVGPYRTEFDALFANRAAPGRSRAIHRGLPHWREAIDLRTAAVQAAASAVQSAETAYGQQKAMIETVLFAHQVLSQQRRAFLNAVRAYNAEIVEYASYVAGPTTSTATLVNMLTRSKPTKTSAGNATSPFAAPNQPTLAPPPDSNVQPAAALESAGDIRNTDGAAQPQTELKEIDEGRRD